MYNIRGVIYQYRHEVDSSNTNLIKAQNIAEALADSSLLVKSVGNLSINYRNAGEYKKAIDYNLIILAYYNSQNDTARISNVLSEIGNSYIYLDNYNEGINYQKEALKLAEAINYVRGIGNYNHSLAFVYMDLEELDSALFYSQKAVEAHIQTGNIFGQEMCQRQICSIEKKQGATDLENLECCQKTLALSLVTGNKEGKMLDLLNISRAQNNLLRFNEALENTKKALSLAKELGDRRVMLECYESIGTRFFNLKSDRLAYKYLDSARALDEEIRQIDIQNAVLEADKKFQVAEKEKEVLKAQQEKAEAELVISQRNLQLGLFGGGTALLILGGGFLFYRNRKDQEAQLAKVRIDEQQKGLSAVIFAQEDERKRIAKDLHDGIVQQLGALKINLTSVFSKTQVSESDKIIKILDDSTTELRELSHKMMPRALGELGLIPALKEMLDTSLDKSTITHQFEHFGIDERLNERIEIALYRIAQELITNVIRHSKATSVNVQLFKNGNNAILIVEDNGKGIAENSGNGIGLMNISSRLDVLNGRVNFEPSSDSGTLATVKIPLAQ
jgi:signal transduction histidine kinase